MDGPSYYTGYLQSWYDVHSRSDGQNPLHFAKLLILSASGAFVFINVALADIFNKAKHQ